MMNGGEFIKKIRKFARKRRVPTKVVSTRGKGSHVTLYYGNKFTIVKDRKKEIGEGLLNKMLQQLGLKKDDLKQEDRQ